MFPSKNVYLDVITLTNLKHFCLRKSKRTIFVLVENSGNLGKSQVAKYGKQHVETIPSDVIKIIIPTNFRILINECKEQKKDYPVFCSE